LETPCKDGAEGSESKRRLIVVLSVLPLKLPPQILGRVNCLLIQ